MNPGGQLSTHTDNDPNSSALANRPWYYRLAASMCAVIAIVVVGCDSTPRNADLTWTEPVQLLSGETVKIERHVVMWHERAFGGGYSSAPVYRTSSLMLLPPSDEFPVWDAPFVPITIDKDPANGEWVIVASIDECGMWVRNGRPRPPYWAFRLRDRKWRRDAVPDFLLNQPANLFVEMKTSDSSGELNASIEQRKRQQTQTPSHPVKYAKVGAAADFEHCDERPSAPIGRGELDLEKFGDVK